MKTNYWKYLCLCFAAILIMGFTIRDDPTRQGPGFSEKGQEYYVSETIGNGGHPVCFNGECRTEWPLITTDDNGRGNELACDEKMRGQMVFLQGATNIPDTIELCVKTSFDTYRWRTI